MPIRPRSGSSRVVRQRKSCCNSAGLGCICVSNNAEMLGEDED